MTPLLLLAHLAAYFGTHRPRTTTERDLQDAIAEALRTLPGDAVVRREHALTRRDRPDFYVADRVPACEACSGVGWTGTSPSGGPTCSACAGRGVPPHGGVAVEVKTKGGLSDLTRQVYRYAELASVSGVLVVTTKNMHARLPPEAMGKPVATLCLADYLL